MLIDHIVGKLHIINPDFNPFYGASVLNKKEMSEYADFKIGVNKKVCKLRNELRLIQDSTTALIFKDDDSEREKRRDQFERWIKENKYALQYCFINQTNYKESSLLLTCKSRSNKLTLNQINKDWGRIFISTNHFYTLNNKMLKLISNLPINKVKLIVFNKEDSISFNKRVNKEFEYILVPPVVDQRFINKGHTRANKIASSGSISYIKNNKDIWNPENQKFMYFGRYLIYKHHKSLNINSKISNVSINTLGSLFLNRIKAKYFSVFQDLSKNSYYTFDLVEFYNNSLFFLCPEDIWGVFPLAGWEALACGSILVMTKKTADKTYGFVDNINYISIDNPWSYKSLKNVVDRINNFDELKIKNLQQESEKIANQLINNSRGFWSSLKPS